MRKLILFIAILSLVSTTAFAGWVSQPADPGLWPYADGPFLQNVDLKHLVYRQAGVVAEINGKQVIAAVGGVSLRTYDQYAPGSATYPGNRQSKFSIFTPTSFEQNSITYLGGMWNGAFGGDDIGGVSVGLTGYNNGNGTASPTVGQGTGYVADNGFYYDGGIYVYGGYPQWNGQMARYDIATNSWANVAAAGHNDGLYTTGGGGLIGSDWYKVRGAGLLTHFDAMAGTFGPDIAIAGLPAPQIFAASGVIGDKLYIVDTDAAGGAVYQIDPVAATFTTMASAPVPVREAGSITYGKYFILLGGRAGAANTDAIDLIQVFDSEAGTWFKSGVKLPSSRSGMLAEIIGENVYVGNGLNNLASPDIAVIDDLWVIDVNEIIPEPGSIMMIGTGLLGLLAFLKRRK